MRGPVPGYDRQGAFDNSTFLWVIRRNSMNRAIRPQLERAVRRYPGRPHRGSSEPEALSIGTRQPAFQPTRPPRGCKPPQPAKCASEGQPNHLARCPPVDWHRPPVRSRCYRGMVGAQPAVRHQPRGIDARRCRFSMILSFSHRSVAGLVGCDKPMRTGPQPATSGCPETARFVTDGDRGPGACTRDSCRSRTARLR
jgi:hypothetical protein